MAPFPAGRWRPGRHRADATHLVTARRTIFIALALAACSPGFTLDTHATSAEQQANKVQPGVIVGIRHVAISGSGAIGTVSGAAGSGIATSRAKVGNLMPFATLLAAPAGSIIGGLAGAAADQAMGNTAGYEYIVRKPGGDLLSVTQRGDVPLARNQRVLIIGGNQAQVLPDDTVTVGAPANRADQALVSRFEPPLHLDQTAYEPANRPIH